MKLHLVEMVQKSILSFFLIGMAFTVAVQAATFTVNQLGDSGDGTCDATCTLRDAVLAANAVNTDDIIDFTVTGTITLNGTELAINDNGTLTINGTGAGMLTVSGNNASRVFYVNPSANLTLNSLTISNGNGLGLVASGFGGGIFNEFGTLSVMNSSISGNTASAGGGGILSSGNLTVTNSTVSENVSGAGGGLRLAGTTLVTNSTISGNSAGGQNGGGIFLPSGSLIINYTTITGNSAGGGGGITANPSTIGNSIVSGNTASFNPDINGRINSLGYNLIGNTSGVIINGDATGNIYNQNAMLAPLGNYGGPTQTHALMPGSPAIDSADPNNFPPTDQRGNLRPADGNPNSLKNSVTLALLPDMGAFEMLAPTSADASISGRVLSAKGRGMPNTIVHLTEQSGNVLTVRTNQFGYYRFEEIEVGQTLILNVYSRRYQYDTQIMNFDDSLTNLNFTPQNVRKRSPKTEQRE